MRIHGQFPVSKGVPVHEYQLHENIYLAAPKISDPQLLGFYMSHLVASFPRMHNLLPQIASLITPKSTIDIYSTRSLWMFAERET